MNMLDYYVKRCVLPHSENSLCSLIRDEATDGFKLKQILTKSYEGSTEGEAFLIFEKDVDLISVNVFYNNGENESSEELLLTASKLELLRNIGLIEIDGERYSIKEITPCWKTEEDLFYCVIETEKINL